MNELGNTKDERLLKAVDIARILNISKALAYGLIQQGDIPALRINRAVRVKPKDLDSFIERCWINGKRKSEVKETQQQ